ncbi:MAG: hypothetical protein ACT4PO_07700 [Actinomycetota bacterium]
MPQKRAYHLSRRGSTAPGIGPVSLPVAEADLRSRRRGHPAEIKLRGEDRYGPRRPPAAAAAAARERAKRSDIGEAVWVRDSRGVIQVLRPVYYTPDPAPPIPDSSATASLRRIWDFIYLHVPGLAIELGYELRVGSLGIFACRRKRTGGEWSEHAFHNAWDFYLFRPGVNSIDMRAMDCMVDLLITQPYVCEAVWRVPLHYTHAHVTGCPTMARYAPPPPCA